MRLSFLVVGAQKSGTTALYHYLRTHPELFLPPQKELEFFSRDEFYEKGVDWYLCKHFARARASQVAGEVSPQYMFEPGKTAARIRWAFPDIKLVMVLRNPIDRAFSHYRMAVRRFGESRSFDAAIADALNGAGSRDVRQDYLRLGEYGRALHEYLVHFPLNVIKIVFTEELKLCPRRVMSSIFTFLDVPPHESMVFGRRYHVGGSQRFPGLDKCLRRHPVLTRTARLVLSETVYNRLWFWFTTELNVRGRPPEVNHESRKRLQEFFSEDVAKLKRVSGLSVPWVDFEVASRQP